MKKLFALLTELIQPVICIIKKITIIIDAAGSVIDDPMGLIVQFCQTGHSSTSIDT